MWNKYWWISSSTLRVHEKCERSFKEISSLFDLFFHKWKDRWYPPTESCIQQNKWGCKNNRGLFSWYGKIIWRGKLVLKRDWATSSAWSGEHRGRASRSIWLCKWRGGWFAWNIDQQCCQAGRRVSFFCQLFVEILLINRG